MVATEADWRPIPGWDGFYEASAAGQIRSVLRVLARPHPKNRERVQSRAYGGKILSPKIGRNGYATVQLSAHNQGKTVDVHRLVCAAFTGVMKQGMDVNHINGCRTDNRAENLEWLTRKANLLHAEAVLGKKMVWTYARERAEQRRAAA